MQAGKTGRHAAVVAELAEWQEDLWRGQIGSQVVLVKVPAGWGRSTVLDRFQAEMGGREHTPVTLTVRVNGQDLPGDLALQARALRACLAGALHPDGGPEGPLRAVELLGLDEPGGQAQLGLGIGALFVAGLTAGVSFLLAGVAEGVGCVRGGAGRGAAACRPPRRPGSGRWLPFPADGGVADVLGCPAAEARGAGDFPGCRPESAPARTGHQAGTPDRPDSAHGTEPGRSVEGVCLRPAGLLVESCLRAL